MSILRVTAIITAGLSSAVSFYILTRSGLTGTLVGALVSGVVYNVASLGLNHGWDKSSRLLKPNEPANAAAQNDRPPGPATAAGHSPAAQAASPQSPRAAAALSAAGRRLPALLGAAALVLSIWAVTNTGTPGVIRERIVEQPIVQERVVIQTVTVTGGGAQAAEAAPVARETTTSGAAAPTASAAPSTSTTQAPPATTTTVMPAASTTTAGPAPEEPALPGTTEGSASSVEKR